MADIDLITPGKRTWKALQPPLRERNEQKHRISENENSRNGTTANQMVENTAVGNVKKGLHKISKLILRETKIEE